MANSEAEELPLQMAAVRDGGELASTQMANERDSDVTPQPPRKWYSIDKSMVYIKLFFLFDFACKYTHIYIYIL
jgi:hypothetical protein